MFFSCGCPSPKVAGHGCFGVRLMLDPKVSGCVLVIFWFQLFCRFYFVSYASNLGLSCLQGKFVGEAMSVIASKTDAPVSVKCRIGVDDHDSYNELCTVSSLCSLVRKQWLVTTTSLLIYNTVMWQSLVSLIYDLAFHYLFPLRGIITIVPGFYLVCFLVWTLSFLCFKGGFDYTLKWLVKLQV